MKYLPTTIVATAILAMGVGSLFGQDSPPPTDQAVAQPQTVEDDAFPLPLPTTIEVKSDDYVVTDQLVYAYLLAIAESHAELHGKVDLVLQRTDEAGMVLELTPEPAPPGVNLNTASYDELLTVPGIGPVKAGSIIAERGQNGLFNDWQDLVERVSGVGPATLADIQAGGAFLE